MFGEPWGSCVLHIFAAIWALVVAFSWQHRPYSPWLVNCSYASPAACCLVCRLCVGLVPNRGSASWICRLHCVCVGKYLQLY